MASGERNRINTPTDRGKSRIDNKIGGRTKNLIKKLYAVRAVVMNDSVINYLCLCFIFTLLIVSFDLFIVNSRPTMNISFMVNNMPMIYMPPV